jgi:hypothetical protein
MDAMNGSRHYELIVEKLRDLMPELRRRYSVRSLEVFGSFVRGEEQAGDGQAVGRRAEQGAIWLAQMFSSSAAPRLMGWI